MGGRIIVFDLPHAIYAVCGDVGMTRKLHRFSETLSPGFCGKKGFEPQRP